MKNYLALIRMVACLIGMMLVLVSCYEPASVHAQPQVVRKKIMTQTDRPEPASQSVANASPGPAPTIGEPKQTVAEFKPQEASPSGPRPGLPTPKPKEPPPPTQTGKTAPREMPPAVESPKPEMAAQQIALSSANEAKKPNNEAKMPNLVGQRSEEAVKATGAHVSALLNIQTPPPYSANGKVDPFEPLLRDDSAQAAVARLTPKKRVPQSPLERIDLGQLKLVAIICANQGNRALVEESSGKGYILREGTYIGMNSGKVVDITMDKVLIEEEFEDLYGKTIMQKKEITLPKPPGEL